MSKSINKTAYNFFLCLDFICKQQVFSIEDIVVYLAENHKIAIYKETILKYLRTMKFLGITLKRMNNKVYSLEKMPISFVNQKTEKLLSKIITLLENYCEVDDFMKGTDLINKLSLFLSEDVKILSAKKSVDNLQLPKINVQKLEKYCLDKQRLEISFLDKNYGQKKSVLEPIDIIVNKNKLYLKGFDIIQKKCVLINLESVQKIKQTTIKDKHLSYKHPVTIKFLNKFACSYSLKDDEEILKKEMDALYVKSFYYDKKIFFNNILRYMENCEIVAPKGLRQEYKNYLIDLYQKYDCPNVK